jgi:hypothetical protein
MTTTNLALSPNHEQAQSVQNEALFDVLVGAVDILTKIDMIKVLIR